MVSQHAVERRLRSQIAPLIGLVGLVGHDVRRRAAAIGRLIAQVHDVGTLLFRELVVRGRPQGVGPHASGCLPAMVGAHAHPEYLAGWGQPGPFALGIVGQHHGVLAI